MKILRNRSSFPKTANVIVTVGTFDGVHLGHQQIMKQLVEEAKQTQGASAVITFHPHPRTILHLDNKDLRFINTQQEKIKLFEKLGIDYLLIIPFTKEFAKLSSKEFVQQILVQELHVKKLIIGHDHHFGKDRMGNINDLLALGKKLEFEVEEIGVQTIEGISISSTKIRHLLLEGDVSLANQFLGYQYMLSGKVVTGTRIGTKLGFPTANILVDDPAKLIPAHGVYVVKAMYNGKTYNGMMNIGFRPTFKSEEKTVEIHLFDFSKDIYGEHLEVQCIERIRDEKKFDSPEQLREQIIQDKEISLKILSKLE